MPNTSPWPELPTPHTDVALCRETLSGGSRSFWVASHLLPRTLSDDASGLYAFCREADDAIDDGEDANAALDALQQRLSDIYRGCPQDSPVDRVMVRIVREHQLPRPLLEALLEGFAWDTQQRRYHNLNDVIAYSARVAGVVGVMMTVLMGERDPQVLARAADLGVAMQLTNIARDVGEDARAGRLYLPENWLRNAGIDVNNFLADARFTPELGEVIARLLSVAESLYHRSEAGITRLPSACKPGIYAARLLYAEIGRKLLTDGCDSITQRAYIDLKGKLRLVAKATRSANLSANRLAEPVLPECEFLINAVTAEPLPNPAKPRSDSMLRSFYRRMVWMLDVFAALDSRSQNLTAGNDH